MTENKSVFQLYAEILFDEGIEVLKSENFIVEFEDKSRITTTLDALDKKYDTYIIHSSGDLRGIPVIKIAKYFN